MYVSQEETSQGCSVGTPDPATQLLDGRALGKWET